MDATQSTDDFDLPWTRRAVAASGAAPHLAIAWSLEEPDRVGECAMVPPDGGLLGRGTAEPGAVEALERLRFGRARPGANEPGLPLLGARISRRQLRLVPLANGEVEVESIGRCPFTLNGTPVEKARARPGDVLTLKNAMVLLLVSRRTIDAEATFAEFPFGLADTHGMVGESNFAWELRRALAFAARSGEHVLLLGDSGAGKELAARAIHAMSPRSTRPMASRNAATLPEGLVDAELFGNAKNYPQHGMPERPGLIGAAHGSTLFLDEIGELPTALQAHLLRVLDRGGEYQRLGDAEPLTADFRLIAATNRDAEALKHDLLARLPLRIKLPGLNERREDLPLFVRHVLRRQCEATGDLLARFFERRNGDVAEPRIEPDLIEILLRHSFTTHVRELERLLWVALSTSEDDFVAATPQLRAEIGTPPEEPELEPDRAAVEEALSSARGNVTRAARLLRLKNRYVLYRILRRLDISVKEN